MQGICNAWLDLMQEKRERGVIKRKRFMKLSRIACLMAMISMHLDGVYGEIHIVKMLPTSL